MSKNICNVCNKEFEDKYFDKKQNKCILHCEKDDWYDLNDNNEKDWSKSDEKIKYFWTQVRNYILSILNDSEYKSEPYYINFKNYIFPKFEDEYVESYEEEPNYWICEYWHDNFCDSSITQNNYPNNNLDRIEGFNFNCSIFLDIVDFSNYEFNNLFFKNVIFNGECKFINSKIASISFQKTIFHKATILKNTSLNFYTYKVKDFEDCEFYETLTFDKVVFNENKSKILDLEFNNTKFKRLHIHGINFEKGLIFLKKSHIEFLDIQGCKIKNLHIEAKVPFINIYSNTKGIDKLIIKQKQLEKLIIFNSVINSDFLLNDKLYKKNDEFKLNLLNFKESTFKGKVKIQFYDCIQDVNFYNTKFEDLADFYRTKFYKVNFEKTDFKNIAVFSESEFYCDVNFNYTKFLATSIFKDTVITGKLNLRDTIFKDEANFLDIKLSKVGNRETARIIKDSFEQQNNIIEANKYYALEMKEREKELEENLKNGKNFFEWLVFKIHGISSNHSQDWTLSLFWIFIVGFIASYYDFNLIQNSENKYIHYNLSSIFKTIGLIFIILFIDRLCKIKDKFVNISYFIISSYLIYIYATEDYLLSLFSQTINPFSVMKTNDPINGIQLFFKIIIAYLIYQLIISIRQNTRRK